MGGTRKARAAALRFVTLPAAPESAGARRDIRPVSCNPPALAPLRFAEIQRDALRRAETGTESGTEFTLAWPGWDGGSHPAASRNILSSQTAAPSEAAGERLVNLQEESNPITDSGAERLCTSRSSL